jgi:hypothetical protein
MLVPNACPECQEGDLVVEYGIAKCDACQFIADVNTVRRVLTIRALEARRKSRQAAAAA